MGNPKYLIALTQDEEKIAQLLTRDAWGYFSALISHRELFHVKDIPMMPRQGTLAITPDEELIQYYLDFAIAYSEELSLYGWDAARAHSAADGLATKLEQISGQVRGRRDASTQALVG